MAGATVRSPRGLAVTQDRERMVLVSPIHVGVPLGMAFAATLAAFIADMAIRARAGVVMTPRDGLIPAAGALAALIIGAVWIARRPRHVWVFDREARRVRRGGRDICGIAAVRAVNVAGSAAGAAGTRWWSVQLEIAREPGRRPRMAALIGSYSRDGAEPKVAAQAIAGFLFVPCRVDDWVGAGRRAPRGAALPAAFAARGEFGSRRSAGGGAVSAACLALLEGDADAIGVAVQTLSALGDAPTVARGAITLSSLPPHDRVAVITTLAKDRRYAHRAGMQAIVGDLPALCAQIEAARGTPRAVRSEAQAVREALAGLNLMRASSAPADEGAATLLRPAAEADDAAGEVLLRPSEKHETDV